MIISTAKKNSDCPACGAQMAVGSPIAMGRKRYGFMHAECMLDLVRLRAEGKSRPKLAEVRDRVAAR